MSATAADRLIIFDTTLRDGEQSPGASMNLAEKLEMAHALKDLGVDVIEAGFPIASPGDFEAVQAIAREVHGPIICGLARCNPADIDRAWAALKDAPARASTSSSPPAPSTANSSCGWRKEEIVRRAVEGVERAKGYCDDVEFSPEDAARTELDFLAEVVERAIEAGATTVNIPDTVGYAVPEQYAAAIRHLKKHVRGIDKVVLSVHCHNDLGLAVANSLAALQGRRPAGRMHHQRHRRAGRQLRPRRNRHGGQDAAGLLRACRRRSTRSCSTRPAASSAASPAWRCSATRPSSARTPSPTRPASTRTACSRTAPPTRSCGPRTSACRGPSWCWASTAAGTPCGSGCSDLGYHLDDDQLQKLFEQFKVLADRKKEIYDADIEALAEAQIHRGPQRPVDAGSVHQQRRHRHDPDGGRLPVAGRTAPSSARRRWATARSTPCSSPSSASPASRSTLRDYRVRSVTIGEDAQGEAQVEVEYEGKVLSGRGVSTDIIEASAQAYLQVINRIALQAVARRADPADRRSAA